MPGGGGGADLDVITAGAGDILAGKIIVDKNGEPLKGTMPNRGAVSQSLAINGTYTIPAGYHNGSGEVSQSVPTQGGSTTTPGTANKTIVAAGRYVSGDVVVKGDSNLVSQNVIEGKTIFDVSGSAKQWKYKKGNVTSSSGRVISNGIGTYYYAVTLNNLGFTPWVGWLIYYTGGERDITLVVKETGTAIPGKAVNFSTDHMFGMNSSYWEHGEEGVSTDSSSHLYLPVAHGSVSYGYWFAGY